MAQKIEFIIPIVIILQMFLIFHNIETSPKEEEKPIFTDSSTSGYYSTIVIDSCVNTLKPSIDLPTRGTVGSARNVTEGR